MYRTIDAAFWTDPKVRGYDVPTKLFALYLVTNPHSHLGGIYYLPDVLICDELGIIPTELDTLWNTLSETGFARKDAETSVVWVIRMFFYQGRGEKNNRAVANHLESLHNSFLIKDFISVYECVRPYLSHRVSDRVSDTHSHFGTPNRNRTGTEQEREKEADSPAIENPTLQLPLKANTERNREWLEKWQQARKLKHGSRMSPISWEAEAMTYADWSEQRWYDSLVFSTRKASLSILDATNDYSKPRDRNGKPAKEKHYPPMAPTINHGASK